jgi:Icc-related predicted phosphoesterase
MDMGAPSTDVVRLAAAGDLHFGRYSAGTFQKLFGEVVAAADVFIIPGDLTDYGLPDEARALARELAQTVKIPVVAVLGNHDFESGHAAEVSEILREAGIIILDGDSAEIHGIGFAGVKGFAGGFGRGALAPFGERLIKDFVQAAIEESIKLENALRNLRTDTKIVLLHFAPIVDTVLGEPESIYPFLGSSRLLEPLDTIGATVIFHGHAHHGRPSGTTPGGIPVYNVAQPLLEQNGHRFLVWTNPAPERRKREDAAEGHATSRRAARPPARGAGQP